MKHTEGRVGTVITIITSTLLFGLITTPAFGQQTCQEAKDELWLNVGEKFDSIMVKVDEACEPEEIELDELCVVIDASAQDRCADTWDTVVNCGSCPDDLNTCISDLTSVQSDLVTCQGDLATAQSNYTTCSNDLSTCNANYGTCQSNLGSCTTSLTATQTLLTTCQSSLATSQNDLAACEESEGDLQAQVTTLTDENAALGDTIDSLNEQLEDLTEQVDSLQDSLNECGSSADNDSTDNPACEDGGVSPTLPEGDTINDLINNPGSLHDCLIVLVNSVNRVSQVPREEVGATERKDYRVANRHFQKCIRKAGYKRKGGGKKSRRK